MSLLRLCAFAKCLNRRSLFEQCAVRLSRADLCVLCVSLRDGAVRRISVLEARIQQLQSDTVLDVQHAKVNFLKDPSSGNKVLSNKAPKSTTKKENVIPKSEQTGAKEASKSKPRSWMEKLKQEEKKKLQYLKKETVQSKVSKSSSSLPSTSLNTISTTAKKDSALDRNY
ncbi:hypothetical protein KUCAC02_023371 [Chaenocephalus aceratus]|uniref:Uncharacterized protein n=1 Tax=Chaenocephalus aceratus TaxID=36190 RepID=A0ACB9XRL3_CHAAC|nr:hypothetical protein KUCAC02_023371 [Chaenocephalus aceratus]